MIIGVPKERINNENRVAITPSGTQHLVNAGHKVLIEKGAGEEVILPMMNTAIPGRKYWKILMNYGRERN